jgi:hypothetical protein
VDEQKPAAQSVLATHDEPMAQPGHEAPPQSIPVSVPFLTASTQLAC